MENNYLKTHRLSGNNYFNILIGILGMLFVSYGNLMASITTQKNCYLLGGILLLISSVLEKQSFFIILQSIILAGIITAFLPLAATIKIAIPIICSVIAIVYFIRKGFLNDLNNLIGCIGICFLAVGYAVIHPVIYFLGATALTIFSYNSFRKGIKLGLVWTFLNCVFMFTAAIGIYRLFF